MAAGCSLVSDELLRSLLKSEVDENTHALLSGHLQECRDCRARYRKIRDGGAAAGSGSGVQPAVGTKSPSGIQPAIGTKTPSGIQPAVGTRTPSGVMPAVGSKSPSGVQPAVTPDHATILPPPQERPAAKVTPSSVIKPPSVIDASEAPTLPPRAPSGVRPAVTPDLPTILPPPKERPAGSKSGIQPAVGSKSGFQPAVGSKSGFQPPVGSRTPSGIQPAVGPRSPSGIQPPVKPPLREDPSIPHDPAIFIKPETKAKDLRKPAIVVPPSPSGRVVTVAEGRRREWKRPVAMAAVLLIALGLIPLFRGCPSSDPNLLAVSSSPTPTPTPTPTTTSMPSVTPSVSPSPSPTFKPTPSPTPTIEPTRTPSPMPTITPTPSPTPTFSPTPTPTFTPTPSPTPEPTPTPSPSPTPSPRPTPTPSPTPSRSPTPTPTPSPSRSPEPAAPMRWQYVNDVDSAVAESTRTGKPALIFLRAPWCRWSRRMDEETFLDREVGAAISRRFTTARVDRDQLRQEAKRLRVEGLPDTVILEADGSVLTRIEGYLPPRLYLRRLQAIADALERAASLEVRADDASTRAERIRLYADIEAWDRAAAVAREMEASNAPGDEALRRLALGMAELRGKDADAALDHFAQGLASDPANASGRTESLLRGEARVHFGRKDTDAALKTCDEALRRFPQGSETAWWHFASAIAQRSRGNTESAYAETGEALKSCADPFLRDRIEQLRSLVEPR